MKNKLLLVQWPAMIGDEAVFFEQFGYEITRIYVLFLENIADIDLALNVDGLSLVDFNVIVLAVAGGPPPELDSHTFSEEAVRVLKNKISNLGKQIVLVGKNWGLSQSVEVSQSKLFDGLFLGDRVPFEKVSSILQGEAYFVS